MSCPPSTIFLGIRSGSQGGIRGNNVTSPQCQPSYDYFEYQTPVMLTYEGFIIHHTFEFNKLQSCEMPGEVSKREGDEIPTQGISGWKGHESRVANCTTHFSNFFGAKPTFFVRVPGRVNLIGEHVDYCGYGVFPMAIEQDVFISGRIGDTGTTPTLRLINTCESYPAFHCQLAQIREILGNRKPGVPQWHLYFLCGVLGILEECGLENSDRAVSLEICIDGRVPARAGLSSSSALVCASALATLVANKGEMGRREMASLCAKSERYIGTQGGGMDQAIAFMATAGTAQRIEFMPELSGEKVALPSSAVFVIANSLVEANKAASDGYNVRVAECRLATWILAKRSGLDFQPFEKVKQLQIKLGYDFYEMQELVDANIHKEPYSAQEIAKILQIELEDLAKKPLMNRIPVESLQLKVYQRVTHVLQEAARVEEFHQVCMKKKSSGEARELARLGELMNASHASLRDLYECSHPQLDKLVALSQSLTHGARLTGAGWGGCMVALLDESQVSEYLDRLRKDYYNSVVGIDDINAHVFITQPGSGATIFEI